jgi:hypothetical protein
MGKVDQIAVDWLWDLSLIKELSASDFEQAKEMEFRHHGLFLHWVIKHYSTETVDGMFAWVDSMGKEVTVREILKHYYKETNRK